ncbi:MAG: hypothetical protein R3C52_08240 [Hyphomonadaceae bacterium]
MFRSFRRAAAYAALAVSLALSGALVTAPAHAQRISEESGVRFADPNERIEGPKTLGGAKAFESPLPYFKDLGPWDPAYTAPRTSFGAPDLQGVWSSASLTTMTRGTGRNSGVGVDTLVIPPEKVAEATSRAGYTKSFEDSQKRTDPKSGVFTDGDTDAGYNAFWIDPGSEWGRVNGEWRSSWIVDPPNGQLPFSREGRAARASRMTLARSVDNTGPEIRTFGDRCLISFGNQGGPPLSNAMYNNHIQVTQSPDFIVLDIEMNHDARIIPIRQKGAAPASFSDGVRPWFGDSYGWWEGDTLVVETRNLHPIQANGYIPISEKGVVTERFKRVSDVEIFYSYAVDDPVNYTQVWKGEMPLRRSKEKLYEYACHEGNYALPGILRGMVEGRDTAIEASGE